MREASKETVREPIDLYRGNHAVATRLLQRAFWMRKRKRLKQGEKGIEGVYGRGRGSSPSIGITRLCLSTEVHPKLKILPHIPLLSIKVVSGCLFRLTNVYFELKNKTECLRKSTKIHRYLSACCHGWALHQLK